ncbi:hypothetical protein TWF694_010721 [Orbilia ellipsospora]|uniref:Uncharacterized protein n=1 Tax=Orbilia ellipsospora TaxID=2528407 RepID=A0AAV9X6V5_9PEZI
METEWNIPIFEETDLLAMLKNGQVQWKGFLQPRQEFLRASVGKAWSWRVRPMYRNIQIVLNYLRDTSVLPDVRRVQNVKDLLERLARLDNHTTLIYAAINEIFETMRSQQRSLEYKLSSLRKDSTTNERLILELKKAYESSWKSLRTDLKAQKDVLAIEEDLRASFMKELKIVFERGASNSNGSWWKSKNQ